MRGTRAPLLLHRLRHEDDGLGMLLVLAMGAILTTLMIVSTTAAVRAVNSSREHVSFESAVAVSEAGIDVVLARAQQTYSSVGTDSYVFPTSSTPGCAVATPSWPFVAQPTAAEERSWARARLLELAAVSGCRQTTPNGEFAVLKPVGRQVVYAMGWAPRYGTPAAEVRLLKAEYLFTPYRPTHAILTSGSLSIDASTTVTSAPPNSPSLAAVHTNGSLVVSNGNPTVFGPVTQSGGAPTASSNKFYANSGGAVVGKAKQTIPYQGALAVWGRNRLSSPPGGWYDLCPDGTARTPDGASPCTGSVLANVATSGTFRGWSFDGSGAVKKWSATSQVKQGQYSGTYYVHHGDALNPASNSGAPVPNLTVIASASTTTCPKVAGNIDWGSTDMLAPSLANTWLVADQDLRTSSNFQAGSASGGNVVSGFFIAGDQVEMSTSSNGAYGAVISADQCSPPVGTSMVEANSIKNPSIYYDPNGQAPFIDVINTTLWLEYPSG